MCHIYMFKTCKGISCMADGGSMYAKFTWLIHALPIHVPCMDLVNIFSSVFSLEYDKNNAKNLLPSPTFSITFRENNFNPFSHEF